MDCNDGDCIRLTVPATPDAVRITRAGAMGLAPRAGFSYQEVEEMRLAVGEAAALLTGDDRHDEVVVQRKHGEHGANGAPGEQHDSAAATRSENGDSPDTLVVVYAFHRTGLSVELRLESDHGPSDGTGHRPEAKALAAAGDARRATALQTRPTAPDEPPPTEIPQLAAELLDANVDDWEVSTAARKVVLHKNRSDPDDED